MMNRLIHYLAAVACAAAAVAPAAGADLGRLFLTPQQRDDLDRRRTNNIQDAVVTIVSRVTVDGQVTRSGGKDTVWINGTPQQDAPKAADPARVAVKKGEDEGTVTIKIGETLDRISGEVTSTLGTGTIDVGSQKRRQP
ncbi:MAG: hypothetical protein EXR27_16860 [Betaproteobacteria bacterium]|nr:hypothetical protein [Betaproteobacteria bacterium]